MNIKYISNLKESAHVRNHFLDNDIQLTGVQTTPPKSQPRFVHVAITHKEIACMSYNITKHKRTITACYNNTYIYNYSFTNRG